MVSLRFNEPTVTGVLEIEQLEAYKLASDIRWEKYKHAIECVEVLGGDLRLTTHLRWKNCVLARMTFYTIITIVITNH